MNGGVWISWGSGRVPVGVDSNNEKFNQSEKIGGEESHILTIDEIPSHDHKDKYASVNATDGTPLGLSVSGAAGYSSYYGLNMTRYGYDPMDKFLTVARNGNDEPHNNLQPYITCYMWKRIS